MSKHKKSFFERLAGGMGNHDDDEINNLMEVSKKGEEIKFKEDKDNKSEWLEEEADGQLTVDMYQSPHEIVVEAMVAGVKPENLDISIEKDLINIKGSRQKSKEILEENYYYRELYWGGFSRSILLPNEVDVDAVDASVKNGVLIIRLPKIDKEKSRKIKIKGE